MWSLPFTRNAVPSTSWRGEWTSPLPQVAEVIPEVAKVIPQERISERTEQTDVLVHSELRGATESLEKNEQQVLRQGKEKSRSVDRVPENAGTKSGVTPVKKQCHTGKAGFGPLQVSLEDGEEAAKKWLEIAAANMSERQLLKLLAEWQDKLVL